MITCRKYFISILAVSCAVVCYGKPAAESTKPVASPVALRAAEVKLPDGKKAAAVLKTLIQQKDKTSIKRWANTTGALVMNTVAQALSDAERLQLADVIATSPVEGEMRTNLVEYIADIIGNPLLGFYIELFADTPVKVHPGTGGGYAAGTHISIADGLLKKRGNPSTRNTLVHELFHIFNHREKGAGGISALNEGTAIWIFKTAFEDIPANEKELGLAEPAFGTIGYYRDIGIKGYPKHIKLGVPRTITPKGRDVYQHIIMARDPSRLPLFDRKKLQACFDTYFKDLKRNQDFGVYKKEFKKRLQKMLAELDSPQILPSL